MTYVSSLSLTSPLRQSIQNLQSQLADSQSEASSGVYADLGLQLGAHSGISVSLRNETDQLNAYTSSNAYISTRLASTNSVLGSLTTGAQTMSEALIAATAASTYSPSVTTGAQNALRSLIGGLNTSAGDQYVFGGLKTNASPIADYFASPPSQGKTAVDDSFQTAFGTSQSSTAAGSISGTAITSYLNGPFADLFADPNWQQNFSSASSTQLTSNISASQSLTTSVSANQSAFRSLTEGYTILAEFTGSNLSADARAAAITKAQTLINTGLGGLNVIQSNVGDTQTAITTAASQTSAQIDVLTSSVSSLDKVDTVTIANRLAALQANLQTSYQLTSSLQKLSLTNYLTGG